ncbi:MAG TPA: pitrilysin family protein [Gemmatimonadaceae bacterium]|jgi:zinc protease|nr:pitrilysin family protein [Gemmatimonadaceae bacterium]
MRRTRAVALLAPLALALPSGTHSQSAGPGTSRAAKAAEAAIPDIPYKKFVLKNGLTLLVHEDHKAPIVAVNVWYHVGSKNEKVGKTGFAHLFEHLMFNGSENYNDDYFKAVEPIGATDLNGTTNSDRTNYFENVPVSALDRVLWLESDRMGHLLGVIDQARLDEQRGVVQNEKRQGENQPYGKVGITISENTYPAGHPYSWDVIGSMDDLDAASLDDVKEWFRTYYGPANATLSIAGDVDAEEIRGKVERYFGDIPSGPPIVAQDAWIAKMTGTHRQSMLDRVPQARVYKVWNVPGYGTADADYLRLAADVLGGGKSSRLYKRLVYRDRIATSASAFLRQRELGGQFMLMATAQPGGDLAAVEKALDEELATFLANGPTAPELERARTGMRADFIRGMERIGGFGGKSDILAQGQVYTGDPESYKSSLQRVLAATPSAVKSAARRWLGDGVYILSVHPFPEYATSPSDVDRKTMPAVGTPPDAPLAAAEHSTLSNGLKIVLARRSAVPVVSMSLVLDAGYAADASASPGTASMTMSMLDEGTTRRSALQIGDELASLGADLFAGSGLDASTVSLSVLKDKLDPSLDLFADVILHPAFPAADLARVKRTTLARIKQEKVQPVGMALRVLPALLYDEGHAYAQPLTGSGTEASVNAMTREDLARFHDAWFKPNHSTLVVVGDIGMAELKPKLERAFAAWKPGDVPAKNIATVKGPSATRVYILDRPGADQSIIFGGAVIAPRSDGQDLAFDTFNNAFGGAFVSRINMNLREGKHWSYGVQSFAYDARGQRPWIIYAPVQTDKTKESLQELVKELHDVTSARPITADELEAAKGRQTLTLAGRWETGSAVSNALREIVTYGLPDDYYATYEKRVRALTTDDLAKAIASYLDPSHEIWVIAGDRARIEEGIRALNLGEVEILDPDGSPVAGRE